MSNAMTSEYPVQIESKIHFECIFVMISLNITFDYLIANHHPTYLQSYSRWTAAVNKDSKWKNTPVDVERNSTIIVLVKSRNAFSVI